MFARFRSTESQAGKSDLRCSETFALRSQEISNSIGRKRVSSDFCDTNFQVYAVPDNPEKADQAESAMACGGDRSVNVLNAFTNILYRKELLH